MCTLQRPAKSAAALQSNSMMIGACEAAFTRLAAL